MGQHELKGRCELMGRHEPLGRHEPMGRHEAMGTCEAIGRREPKGRRIDRRERFTGLRAGGTVLPHCYAPPFLRPTFRKKRGGCNNEDLHFRLAIKGY